LSLIGRLGRRSATSAYVGRVGLDAPWHPVKAGRARVCGGAWVAAVRTGGHRMLRFGGRARGMSPCVLWRIWVLSCAWVYVAGFGAGWCPRVCVVVRVGSRFLYLWCLGPAAVWTGRLCMRRFGGDHKEWALVPVRELGSGALGME